MTYERANIIQEIIKQRKRMKYFKENGITVTVHFDQEDWQYEIEWLEQKTRLNSSEETFNWLINNGFIDNETGCYKAVEL